MRSRALVNALVALLSGLAVGACGAAGSGAGDRTAGNARPSAAAPVEAAAAEGPGPGAATEPRQGELLLATPPEGWRETGAMQTPVLRMAEYGPAEEAEGRLERLTFEAQTGDPLPDPIEFLLGVSRDLASRCEDYEESNVSSGYENGYPTSVRLMICPRFTDSAFGQVVMAKAIQGSEQFYVITRRLRVPPMEGDSQPLTAEEMARWSAHLRAVQVCDTRDEAHPCPESVTEGMAAP